MTKLSFIRPSKIRKFYRENINTKLYPRKMDTCIVHCCVQKTGSMWFGNMFSDPIFYKQERLHICGSSYNFLSRKDGYIQNLAKLRTKGRIVSPLYVKPSDLDNMDLPEQTSVFGIVRDVRDLVVSDYFSLRYSHKIINNYISEKRALLNSISFEEGISERIRGFESYYSTLKDYANYKENNFKLIKFEDFFGENQKQEFSDLLEHCNLSFDEETIHQLIEKYSFQNMKKKSSAKGNKNHYRSGKKSQWKEHFNDKHIALIKEYAGDILIDLGYEQNNDWK